MGCKRRTGSGQRGIAALAERQHGVVSRQQLRDLGFSDREITTRAAAGALHPIFRGSFAVGHRDIGRLGRMQAALLSCGDGTVVSHGSAAELIGLWDKKPAAVHVIAPRSAGRKLAGIRTHDVGRPRRDEVGLREGIPCTTPSRTLIDMAGLLGVRSLRRMVEQAAVLGCLDPNEIDRLLSRGRRRGGGSLLSVLAPWRDTQRRLRLRSLLEARFVPALARAGLPAPRFNREVQADRHSFEVDMLWEAERLVLEADGEETHGTRMAFQRDRWRDQILLAAGYRTARVTWRQLDDEPDAVVERIRGMLGRAP